MCFQINFNQTNKTYRRLSITYQTITFVYTLASLIISIFAWNNYNDLPLPYVDRFKNWLNDPIYNIYLADTCNSDSESFFELINQNNYYTKWQHENKTFSLCIDRLIGYNFYEKFPTQPYCDENEQLCGGVYVENKYCAPLNQCPINSILFVNSSTLQNIDTTKYNNQIQITDDYYMISSTLAEELPINQISIYGTTACLISQYSNYQTIFSNAYCQEDTIYILLDQITEMTYATANGFTSNTDDKIGVYSRSYTSYSIDCRSQNLVQWAIRTIKDGNAIYMVTSILMIASAINFASIGFMESLYYFIQIQTQQQNNINVGRVFLICKIIIQYFHSIMIVLLFGLWIDIKLFMDININADCTDQYTLNIIQSALNDINQQWILSLIQFSLFLFFIILECVSFSICLDHKLKEKIEPQYRHFTVSSLNQSSLKYNKNQENNNLYYHFKPQFKEQSLIQPSQHILEQINNFEDNSQGQKNLLPNNDTSIPQIEKSLEMKESQEFQFSQNQNNYYSVQQPIQKPSMKYDNENIEIEDDDMSNKQQYKINN